jgi:lysophospholipase L1-like esterase
VLATTTTAAPETDPLVYVPIGNSLTFLPIGLSVNDVYESMLIEDFGTRVDVRNHTVGGERTDAFLERLRDDETLRGDLAEADVITFLIPNDEWAEASMTALGIIGDPADCGGDDDQQCLRDMVADYNELVDQIFEELLAIVDPAEQVVRIMDFFLFHTEAPLDDSRLLYPYWHAGQVHVQEAAAEYGIPIARVWDDFMGTDGEIPNLVDAGLVDPDGIHLTAAGARRVAEMLRDLGYELSEEPGAVAVAGTGWAIEVPTVGDESSRYEGEDSMDDERVSGSVVVTVTLVDREVSPPEVTGEFRLENEGGAWEGDWAGVIEDNGLHDIDGVFFGSGDYEGLVYQVRWEYYDLIDITVTGTIEPVG